ncbi:MAG: hypothetical protein HC876_18470 [Chloroflexaceae bacterium]|nr:hypothetical protein [Chloroflexaceae bacterium]NJO07333.1 hypothetical protein [Chloroflexaceae bacterium]
MQAASYFVDSKALRYLQRCRPVGVVNLAIAWYGRLVLWRCIGGGTGNPPRMSSTVSSERTSTNGMVFPRAPEI